MGSNCQHTQTLTRNADKSQNHWNNVGNKADSK